MSKTRHRSGKFDADIAGLSGDLFFDGDSPESERGLASAQQPLDPGDFEAGRLAARDAAGPPHGRRSDFDIDPPTVRLDLEGPPHPYGRGGKGEVRDPTDPECVSEMRFGDEKGRFEADFASGVGSGLDGLVIQREPSMREPRAPSGRSPGGRSTPARVVDGPERWGNAHLPAELLDETAPSRRAGSLGTRPSSAGGAVRASSRAPLRASVAQTEPAVAVRLPCALLIVAEAPARAARRAASLMAFGYTCRAVTGADAPRALTEQNFDAVVLDIPASHGAEMALANRRAILAGYAGPVVLTAEGPLDPSIAGSSPVVAPAVDDVLARAIERMRVPSKPVCKSLQGEFERTVHVVRATVLTDDGAPRRGRIRSMSRSGDVLVQTQSPLDLGCGVDVAFTAGDGRRIAFAGRVVSRGEDQMRLRLELGPGAEQALDTFLRHARDPAAGRLDPVRICARTPTRPDPEVPTARPLVHWFSEIAERLDDNDAHQAFIQACLKTQRLEVAVRCYRELKEQAPSDERIDRYLNQVGTILGFYALRKDSIDGGPSVPSSVRWGLGLFILAALVLWVLAVTLK